MTNFPRPRLGDTQRAVLKLLYSCGPLRACELRGMVNTKGRHIDLVLKTLRELGLAQPVSLSSEEHARGYRLTRRGELAVEGFIQAKAPGGEAEG